MIKTQDCIPCRQLRNRYRHCHCFLRSLMLDAIRSIQTILDAAYMCSHLFCMTNKTTQARIGICTDFDEKVLHTSCSCPSEPQTLPPSTEPFLYELWTEKVRESRLGKIEMYWARHVALPSFLCRIMRWMHFSVYDVAVIGSLFFFILK